MPELTSLEVPPQLDPHPIYGMAVLTAKPEAMRLALYLLSARGQEIIAREGLVPILDLRRRPRNEPCQGFGYGWLERIG